jgi:DtxR family transcriptional regulator, Mn-dependent transcriptional regulator
MAREVEEVDPMMALVERLRDTLRGVAGWQESCEAGPPVPMPGGCRHVDCHSVNLTALRPGAHGAVSCLEQPWSSEAAKLAGLGVLPGVRLHLVQRYPAYVIRLGRSEIAIDAALAARIRVRS